MVDVVFAAHNRDHRNLFFRISLFVYLTNLNALRYTFHPGHKEIQHAQFDRPSHRGSRIPPSLHPLSLPVHDYRWSDIRYLQPARASLPLGNAGRSPGGTADPPAPATVQRTKPATRAGFVFQTAALSKSFKPPRLHAPADRRGSSSEPSRPLRRA